METRAKRAQRSRTVSHAFRGPSIARPAGFWDVTLCRRGVTNLLMKKSHACGGRHVSRLAGFTLTELLVVIAVVAVIAMLSFTMFGKARVSAGKASAANAMRQTGVAIFMFASENGGWLPPGQGKQGLYLSHNGYDQNHTLFGILAPYIGVEPKSKPQPVPALVSSSHLRLYPDLLKRGGNSRIAVYASSRSIELADGTRREVFGWYGAYQNNKVVSALSLSDVQDARQTPWKWLLQEADQAGGWSASWDASIFPEKPVHGNVRHRLFVDGHVEALSLTESKLP